MPSGRRRKKGGRGETQRGKQDADEMELMAERLEKIGKIFRYFDRDKDGHWNLEEANNAAKATAGESASEEDWKDLCTLLQIDAGKGLSEEDVVRTYLDETVYSILGTDPTQVEKDYEAIQKSTNDVKEEKAETIQNDAFSFNPNNVTFSWEKKEQGNRTNVELANVGNGEKDNAQELVRRAIEKIQLEAQIEDSLKGNNSQNKVDTEPSPLIEEKLVRTKAAEDKMMATVFNYFDQDGDGYWNFDEAGNAQELTEGVPLSEEEFDIICDMLDSDCKKGLALEHVRRMYLDPEFKEMMGMSEDMIAADTLGRDFSIVLKMKGNGQKKST